MGGAITGTGERELPDFPECIVIPLLSVLRRYDLTQALSHKDHQAPFSTSVTAHERERKREKETERKRKRATESGRGRKREEKHPANERKKGEREGASERARGLVWHVGEVECSQGGKQKARAFCTHMHPRTIGSPSRCLIFNSQGPTAWSRSMGPAKAHGPPHTDPWL